MASESALRKRHPHGIAHVAFRAGMFLKGFDGLIETAGGIILIFVKTAALRHTIASWQWDILSKDNDSIIAKLLMEVSKHISVGAKLLSTIYLLAHGIVKLGLAIALLTGHTKFFVPALFCLGVFASIEIVALIESPSFFLAVVVAIDLLIIVSVWLEYRHTLHELHRTR